MRSYSKIKKHRRVSFLKKIPARLGWIIPFVLVILLGLDVGTLIYPQVSAKGMQIQATPSPVNSGIAFLEVRTSGLSKLTHKPDPLGNEGSTISEPFIPASCRALGVYASAHGPWVALDVTCESTGFVQVINTASGMPVDLDPSLTQDSTFLNWAPTGNELILRTGNLPDSRIYLVQVNSGNSRPLPVPGNVYDVALSTDGRRMIYSLTWGLSHGSETWIADTDGGNARRVLKELNHIVAFAHWSPNGQEIAYMRMPDSNVPFTIGELWVMGANGQNPTLVGNADAGHGYRPAWSPDGQEIAFVVREQKNAGTDSSEGEADYEATKLISNVYIANISNKSISAVTEFDGALTGSPSWSPDGVYLAFNTTAGGDGIDVWVLDKRNRTLSQITHGLNARFPTWLSLP